MPSEPRKRRDHGPRGPAHIAWDLATGVAALLRRAGETATGLHEQVVAWSRDNPIVLQTFDLTPEFPRTVFARQMTNRPLPATFAVMAAEVIHEVRTSYDHMRADRRYLPFDLDLPSMEDESFALLTRADNYAKHQALRIVGSVSNRGLAVAADQLGEALGVLTRSNEPKQAGDLVASFDFDRDLRGIVDVRLEVSELIVLDASVLGQRYDLFDMFEKIFREVTHVASPLLKWLEANPERPLEKRTPNGIPVDWDWGLGR